MMVLVILSVAVSVPAGNDVVYVTPNELNNVEIIIVGTKLVCNQVVVSMSV